MTRTEIKLLTRITPRTIIDGVAAAEVKSFPRPQFEPYSLQTIDTVIQEQRTSAWSIATAEGWVIGWFVVNYRQIDIALERFVIRPENRMQGHGRNVAQFLNELLVVQKRKYLQAVVDETAVGTQLFLQKMGWECVGLATKEVAVLPSYVFRRWNQKPICKPRRSEV